MVKTKKCTRCKKDKPDSGFGKKKDRKDGLRDWCKVCESEVSTERYFRDRKTPEGREKIKQWHHKSYWKNRDDRVRKAKLYRESEKGKAARRRYVIKHKRKIFAQERVTKNRYHVKNRDKITDQYCLNLLRTKGVLNPTASEIETKRSEILISRIEKKIPIKKTGTLKKCCLCKKKKDTSEFYIIRKKKKPMSCCKICSNKRSKKFREKRKLNGKSKIVK